MKIQLKQLANINSKNVLDKKQTINIKGGTPIGTIGIDYIGENNSSEQEDATTQSRP